jgi:hypothetical protein
MHNAVNGLAGTLKQMEEKIGTDRAEVAELINRLNRYITNAYEERVVSMSGEKYRTCLDDAFAISIALFRHIDTGTDGLDDKMAQELAKLRVKYLGM